MQLAMALLSLDTKGELSPSEGRALFRAAGLQAHTVDVQASTASQDGGDSAEAASVTPFSVNSSAIHDTPGITALITSSTDSADQLGELDSEVSNPVESWLSNATWHRLGALADDLPAGGVLFLL
jgi:hypothetical protein